MEIREINEGDRIRVMEMMRVFYASEAVSTNGSDEIFRSDIDECLSDSPFLTGYVFDDGGVIAGYAMTAHSFSTEFGKPCVWIEDIYVKEEYRRCGIGSSFFEFLEKKHGGALLRLEAEEDNAPAVALYKKRGFDTLPYIEMYK